MERRAERSSRETKGGEGRRKKEGTSGDQWSVPDSPYPFSLTELAESSFSSSSSSSRRLHSLAAIRGRVYFCNLLEDRQLDFLGSFGYRIRVRLSGSGGLAIPSRRDPNAPQICSSGNGGLETIYTPASNIQNPSFSYLISSIVLYERNRRSRRVEDGNRVTN